MGRLLRGAAACLAVAPLLLSTVRAADPAPFDLAGPMLKVRVTRDGVTLPVGQVPNLAAGDVLDISADLPADQSQNYLLVSAFLHGATNPPPKDWIDSAKTWKKKDKDRSLHLTVPKGARQIVLFMVPETGGDFGTIADAVRGKPGEFVRVTQDLNQASLDRSRLNAFMAGIQAQENTHPEYLRTVAPTLSTSLAIKLNADCLDKVVELQAACLIENRDTLVLTDVHSSSLTDTLTGAPADLAFQISATREAGLGYYSAYIGVVRDVARIFGAFNNPEFQYLPALGVPQGDSLSLILNTAPSFAKPKSVLVAGLPAIEAGTPPPLRAKGNAPICVSRPDFVIPMEGAPLIYSTGYARDMMLKVKDRSGKDVSVPLTARADKGGYVLSKALQPADFDRSIAGAIAGNWGFSAFNGPGVTLQFSGEKAWQMAGDAQGLIVGRDNLLSIDGAAAACVESIVVQQASAPDQSATWAVTDEDSIAVTLPLAKASPGKLTLKIKQYGIKEPTSLTVQAYGETSRIDGLTLYAGDDKAVLTGRRLDQVASIDLAGAMFQPGELRRDGDVDKLQVIAVDGAQARAFAKGQGGNARLALKDGRTVTLPVRILPARPALELLSMSLDRAAGKAAIPVRLTDAKMLPDDAGIALSVRAIDGTRLTSADSLEIATEDQSAAIRLADGSGFRLESPQVAIATFELAKLGPSTAGPLVFRLVQKGVQGNWQPLGTLVRLPQIQGVTCPTGDVPCRLTGTSLFLIDSVASDAAFQQSAAVPQGFTGTAIDVPRPRNGKLFVRLRDAPGSSVEISVPVTDK
ncbi:hypothetical protein [Sphingobium aromaticiconvertens]|uniref:hypothetical protein n=1 Tax=Sphingobium aromaticiconvertens TaxID=365341 RepID=UPI003015AF36